MPAASRLEKAEADVRIPKPGGLSTSAGGNVAAKVSRRSSSAPRECAVGVDYTRQVGRSNGVVTQYPPHA